MEQIDRCHKAKNKKRVMIRKSNEMEALLYLFCHLRQTLRFVIIGLVESPSFPFDRPEMVAGWC